MSPNNASTVAHVEQALGRAAKGVEIILLGDLNVTQEEEIATVVADYGLEDMMDHFMPRRRYR